MSEFISNNWPLGPRENIIVGNPESSVAIATFWTKIRDITPLLKTENYAIVGQLYSFAGINYMLRNLLGNRYIQHLVLYGADLSNSSESILSLWGNGINQQREIIGLERPITIDKEIPINAVEEVRKYVKVHNFGLAKKGENFSTMHSKISQLPEFISSLPNSAPYGVAHAYPFPEIDLTTKLPSESGGRIIRAHTIAEGWLKALKEIMSFGEIDSTFYGDRALGLTNLNSVITDEDPNSPRYEDYFEFSRKEMMDYQKELLNPKLPQGEFYTYGNRLLDYRGVNQAEIILDKLKKHPFDNAAYAPLYDTLIDNRIGTDIPEKGFRMPCLVSLQASLRDGKVELLADFRSHDIFGAWPRNLVALRYFQGWLGDKLGYQLGSLSVRSVRCQLYEDKWPKAQEILNKYGGRYIFEEDPRGNFRIRTDQENGQILVTHQDSNGKALRPDITWDGKRNKASIGLGRKLSELGTISQIDHALDVGRELMKAEIASKLNLSYIQDSDEIIIALLNLAEEAKKYRDSLK